jgi:hypothetical protein
MFPEEELSAIHVSRLQAQRIVEEIVMPDADHLTESVSAITLDGRYAVFEKPKGHQEYYQPPKILIIDTQPGKYKIALGWLLTSVWGHREADFLLGFAPLDPAPRRSKDMQRIKELGMRLSMDWSTREARPIP